MLNKSEIENPEAIEKNVCLKINGLRVHPMDHETTGILIKLLSSDVRKANIPEDQKPHLYKIIEKRVEVLFNFKISDDRLTIFLTQISQTPGTAVMLLWYLQWWCKENNKRELDLDFFCEEIFPFGFPSREDLQKVWDGQKLIDAGNLVDYTSAGQSILN
jgi:hypothetical protein